MSGKEYAARHCTGVIPPKFVLAAGPDHRPLEIEQVESQGMTTLLREEGCRFADYLFEYGASGFLEALRERLDECYTEEGE